MKYEIYSSIEHDNVIEQQMPGIHVHNQIGYTSIQSDRIYMYGHGTELQVIIFR